MGLFCLEVFKQLFPDLYLCFTPNPIIPPFFLKLLQFLSSKFENNFEK